MKTVRVNGKITEVKQPQDQSNTKMGDHLGSIHFVFFKVAEILSKLGNLSNFTNQLEFRKKNSINVQ